MSIALQEWIRPIAYCEIDPYCQGILLNRQAEGNIQRAPIWNDVATFPTKGLREFIDVVYGGFPCQDISIAGNGVGLEGKRSSLVFEIFKIIDEIKSPFLFLENVPNVRSKGAERICKELAERGYDCRWCCLSANDVGAPHKRERWFLLAYNGISNFNSERCEKRKSSQRMETTYSQSMHDSWWKTSSSLCRMDDGIQYRSHRIRSLGNSVVPKQAKEAFKILMGNLGK